MASDIGAYLRQLRRDGYDVSRARGGGHWLIRRGGQLVTVAASTPGKSAMAALRSHVRQFEKREGR